MPLGVLLQNNIQNVKEASQSIYYILGSAAIIAGLVAFIIRQSIKASKMIDKKTLDKAIDEKMETFRENHDKEHALLTKRLEEWATRQKEINEDFLTRLEENSQNQKGINDRLVEKLDTLIPKVTSIETKVDILLTDYNNRVKLN